MSIPSGLYIIKNRLDFLFAQKRVLLLVITFFVICISFYACTVLFVLNKPVTPITEDKVQETITQTQSALKQQLEQQDKNTPISINTKDDYKQSQVNIIIPKIGLNLGVFNGDEKALEDGIWNKFPERVGQDKSNIVLAGHRFSVGVNPLGIQRKSPLLHIEKVVKDDQIYLVTAQKTLTYKVVEVMKVKNNSFWIEDNTNKANILTILTCGEEGAAGDRLLLKGVLI